MMFFRRGPMDGTPCDISYKNNLSRWVCIVVVRAMPEKYATLSFKGPDQIDPLQLTTSSPLLQTSGIFPLVSSL